MKTITIRDQVYMKLVSAKREDESFSELLERIVEGQNSIDVLKELRGAVEFEGKEKEEVLMEMKSRRAERRS